MKNFKLSLMIIGVFACTAFDPPVTAATPSINDLVKLLEDTASICSSGCKQKCSASAKELKRLGKVAGNENVVKNLVKSCSSSTFMDSNARKKQSSRLMAATMQVPQIAQAEKSANARSSASARMVNRSYDTDVYSNNAIDMDKVLALWAELPALCEAGMPTSPINMARSCKNACTSDLESIKKSIASALEVNPKIANLTNRAKQGAVMELARHRQNINTKLTSGFGCLSNFRNQYYKGPEIPFLDVFSKVGKDVVAGKWPSAEPVSLDIDSLIADKPESPADVYAEIKAKDAIGKISFEDAQKKLRALDAFKQLQTDVRKTGYSATQIKNAITKLNNNKDRLSPAQFKNKYNQFADLLSKADLVEAVTQSCDMNYLQKFNQDRIWKNKAQQRSLNPVPGANKIQYLIESVYLHRLCADELHDNLIAKFNAITDQKKLLSEANKYLSRPALSGGATCMGCEPKRIMSDKQWRPKWQNYYASRLPAFNKQKNSQQFRRQLTAALTSSGFENWVKNNPSLVANAMKVFAAKSRSASFQLQEAKKYPGILINNRARRVTLSSMQGSYIPVATSQDKPRPNRVVVSPYLACSEFESNLSRFLENLTATDQTTFNKVVSGYYACSGHIGMSNYGVLSGNRGGNTLSFDREVDQAIKKYKTALTISGAQGDKLRKQIIDAGNRRIVNLTNVTKHTTGYHGYNFEQAYAAFVLVAEFNKFLVSNPPVRRTAGQNEYVEYAEATKQYYQEVTGLNFDDLAAADAKISEAKLKAQQEALLQESGMQPRVKPANEIVSNNLQMQTFFNRCNRLNNTGQFDCNCLSEKYGEAVAQGTFQSDNRHFNEYGPQCLDRELIKNRASKECRANALFSSINCDCYADKYSKEFTGREGLTISRFRAKIMNKCRS